MATRVHREKTGARARRRGIKGNAAASTAALVDAMGALVGQRAPSPAAVKRPQGRSYTRIAKSLSIGGVDARLQLRVELAPPGQPSEVIAVFRIDNDDDSRELRRRLVEERDRLLAALGREMGRAFAVRDVWDVQSLEDEA